jgi:hypothetical protein
MLGPGDVLRKQVPRSLDVLARVPVPVRVADLCDGRYQRSKLEVASVGMALKEKEAHTRREPWMTMPSEIHLMSYVPGLAREPLIGLAGLNIPETALFLLKKIFMIA